MVEFLYFVITFIVIYLLYFFLVIQRKNVLKKFENSTEVMYLKKKYQLDINKVNIKSLAHQIACANAFLLSFTVFLVGIIKNIFLKLLLSIFIMIPLILITYHIIGLYYKKKEAK